MHVLYLALVFFHFRPILYRYTLHALSQPNHKQNHNQITTNNNNHQPQCPGLWVHQHYRVRVWNARNDSAGSPIITLLALTQTLTRIFTFTLAKTNGNFVFEEILNATSHGVAFIASVVARYDLSPYLRPCSF